MLNRAECLAKDIPLIADDQNSFPDVTDHFLYSSTDEYENITGREPFLDGIVSDMDDYFKGFFNNYLIYVNQYGSFIAINADEYGEVDYELLGSLQDGKYVPGETKFREYRINPIQRIQAN